MPRGNQTTFAYSLHDIKITVRYKDNTRDEIFLTHEQTVFVEEPTNGDENETDPSMIIIPIILVIGIAF